MIWILLHELTRSNYNCVNNQWLTYFSLETVQKSINYFGYDTSEARRMWNACSPSSHSRKHNRNQNVFLILVGFICLNLFINIVIIHIIKYRHMIYEYLETVSHIWHLCFSFVSIAYSEIIKLIGLGSVNWWIRQLVEFISD